MSRYRTKLFFSDAIVSPPLCNKASGEGKLQKDVQQKCQKGTILQNFTVNVNANVNVNVNVSVIVSVIVSANARAAWIYKSGLEKKRLL